MGDVDNLKPAEEPASGKTDGSTGKGEDDGKDDGKDTPAVEVATGLTYDPNKVPKTDGGYKDPYIAGFDDGKGGATIPIILDLDGDGVEVAFGEDIYFDLDDDGFLEQTSWAAADDGFLVIDLNADGTRGAGDGVIDQSNELKVWQDLNQDGKTEGDGTELKTLAAWGISSINLAYDDGTDFTDESNDVEVFGNILHGLAVAA